MITPLHYALNNAPHFVDLLLKYGANPNARDDFGNTPMHHASTPELIALLFLNGAKINTKGYGGWTPLFNNIRLSNWPAVKCLLRHGANPNRRDDNDITPLTKALAKKNPKIVRLLLECGADWTQEDGKNKGRLVGYTECLRVLRNHINTHIKDLLVKEFNLMAIHNIMHSPCIHVIETEMLNELMQWIPKHCAEKLQYSNSGAQVLYEYLYEIRKRLLYGTESGSRHW